MKNIILGSLLLFALLACKNNEFVLDEPIPGFAKDFVDIQVDPRVDSTYSINESTSIFVSAFSLKDFNDSVILEPVNLRFRQFDDALDIFLAGIPMEFNTTERNVILQTTGMFELRGDYNGAPIKIDNIKPLKVIFGSIYTDTKNGFFKLNEEIGKWDLIDIPEVSENSKYLELQDKINKLKPEWMIPLPENHFVFSLNAFIDVYYNEDYDKIYKANNAAMKKKLEPYGVEIIDLRIDDDLLWKGNYYPASYMLWKSDEKIQIPQWVKKLDYYGENDGGDWVKQFKLQKVNGNFYDCIATSVTTNKTWSTRLELVTHLRYLIKYTPEQLYTKQAEIAAEIDKEEERLRKMRLTEYTVNVYGMGLYNLDKPIYFAPEKPILNITIDNNPVTKSEIHTLTVFNHDLSSYAKALSFSPVQIPFFKGENKMLLITKSGEIGFLSGKAFMEKYINNLGDGTTLDVQLESISPEDEASLKEYLAN